MSRLVSANGCHSTSLSERQFEKVSRRDPVDLIEKTKHCVVRVYPDGLRQDSSNPDPMDPWNYGVQMVALNQQTHDDSMMFHQGRFCDNGSCGYVLKANYLSESQDIKYNPLDYIDRPSIDLFDQPIRLILTIISGQFLQGARKNPESIADPYVKVLTKGMFCDCHVNKTKFIENNGLNPRWNETFSLEIYFPRLALLCFDVRDHDTFGQDDRLAFFCLPVSTIQTGWFISLSQRKKNEIDRFVFIAFKVIVTFISSRKNIDRRFPRCLSTFRSNPLLAELRWTFPIADVDRRFSKVCWKSDFE